MEINDFSRFSSVPAPLARSSLCSTGRLESSPATFNPSSGGKQVIVGSGDGNVYAFNGATGKQLWSTRLGPAVGVLAGGVGSTPRVRNGVAFVGGPGDLFALSAASGAVLWRYHVGAMIGSSPVLSADGRTLFVGAEDGFLYAFALPWPT